MTQRTATQRTASQRTATQRTATQRTATRTATQRTATQRTATRTATQRTASQRTVQPSPTEPAAGETAAGETAALADALDAEHAAIFAYGLIGVRLRDDLAEDARLAEETHRARRDALVFRLTSQGTQPPAAEPSYQLPFGVTDAGDALRLAVLVEERVAAFWRAVLPEAGGDHRAEALDALVDAAVRATRWRVAAGVGPATVAFPGTV